MPINMPGRKVKIAGVIIVLLLCLFLFRYPIMRGMGNFLIATDEPQQVPVAFVLSGGPFDRGREAVRLYNMGMVETIICTGETVPQDIIALGLDHSEGDITKILMLNQGVPENKIVLIEEGTSTLEESDIILAYCKQNGLKKIGVISSMFHTRRIKGVFKNKFEEAGIEVLIFGAKADAYDEQAWWGSEYGLINLNNEYIKIVYYWLKY